MKASRQLSAVESPTRMTCPPTIPPPTRFMPRHLRGVICGIGLVVLSLGSSLAGGQPILPPTSTVASTVPNNHDVNPYGIAFVPAGLPAGSALQAGDVVVSNFNAASNKQGTGTTIVKLVTDGKPVTFFQGQNLGLTTALAVLKSGYVLVGNLPTTNGATITSTGSLLVITPQGKLLSELKDPTLLDGPWDMTVIIDNGQQVTAFVSNVLNGTVARIDLNIGPNGATLLQSSHLIASGYAHRPDPAALVVGPTGLAYDAAHDMLYVASTNDNKVFAIAGAAALAHDNGPGSVIYQDSNHLRGPLALALAPNGDLVTANGDAINPDPNQSSEIVEFTPDGRFVAQMQVDPAPGSAFGLAFGLSSSGQPQFAAVNDSTNTAIVWTLRPVGGN
ncbi:hypothetical protein GO283_02958 [Ralstonia solanacearum]|uniref:Uncharacterized protein n=1 Tax=Ralstonia nicotianae (strain ATCC BAA-1114 / GMI1000) TaxID=267608 RepID=Q8XWE9_RALN1|nr:hypothetical protein [Ralstonia pseudosolanacearum]NJZ69316.1 hypothetical protein [Ralstonia solanacearum]UZF34137.1 hypothetical protein LGV81_12785 [Ralstonia sp. RS647]CAD16232.2 hypothetical protein RSc2525 [Ralstonia pseudosolanacearum GMI1000]MDO3517183.1 hypothetical protein [Ralstonia pseudosolanacearum]